MKKSLLIIDDEPAVLDALDLALGETYQTLCCATAEDALALLEKRPFSAVLCDLGLPGMGGEALLGTIKAQWPETEVVVLTADRDVATAVRCIRLGAYDYVNKPWDLDEMRRVIERCVERSDLARENLLLKQAQTGQLAEELLGSSSVMQELRELIRRVAAHDSVVLIQGESGTGKELVARSIHNLSARRRERFVAIGCGSIPSELVESELFGHEKGAFSSAYAARTGKFEYASGGTIFLDDVAALPQVVQAKLLRVLQEREICRLGSNRTLPVDVRVISSTNMDLMDLVKKGAFREDLYWRLSGVPIKVPSLRERGEDRIELFEHFLAGVAGRYQRPRPNVDAAVLDALRAHQFPGNVRELMHLAETLFVLAGDEDISATALPVDLLLSSENGPLQELPLKRAVREFERQVIARTLRSTGGNQSKAAARLGIHRNTLMMKLSDLGMNPKLV